MKLLSRMISLIALCFLFAEWRELRIKLAWVYRSHLKAAGNKPPLLAQQLLISGEDHRFFRHGGIDPIAICRAIWRGIILRKIEGASTIEMQVVRVVSGRFERTLRRKIHEITLATLVTREIPKKVLPAIYLEIGYFGWRMNGFEAACRRLGAVSDELTNDATAQIVARLKYPQPRIMGSERWHRIYSRGRHLLWLHSAHKHKRIYKNLMMESRYESI